ncbi:MAG TPA: hypothetical protein VMF70_10535 [Gemmatimonadales bacterium]|nr:hypothetical protein [Gemmatimonadales bacterium]
MSAVAAAAPLAPFLVIGAIAVAVGAGISLALAFEKKRTAALADACLRMGFNFQPEIPTEQASSFGTFHLFSVGHGRKGWNLMTGKVDDAAASVFDYRYTTGGGKNSHTWTQTVAIIPGAGGLPEFMLSPEHWWDKIGEIFGHKDINFEASPDFSKHYLLRGPDEGRIRAAFGAEALGYFAQHPDWSVEVKDDAMAIYRRAKRPKPEEMQSFVADVASVRRALVHS